METVLKDLRPLFPLLYEALEVGAQAAREYFDELCKPIEPYLAADIARYHAREFLLERGQAVSDLRYKNTPNIGLYLEYGKYRIRIWKTSDGYLPYPGTSRSKELFLRQITLDDVLGLGIEERLNLVVLWDVDSEYRLKYVKLVCPKKKTVGRIEALWSYVIPHPAYGVQEPQVWTEENIPFELVEELADTEEGVE